MNDDNRRPIVDKDGRRWLPACGGDGSKFYLPLTKYVLKMEDEIVDLDFDGYHQKAEK